MGNWPVKENKAMYAAYHGLVHIDKRSEAKRRMAFTKREQSIDKLSCCRANNQACRWVLTVVAGDDWQPVGS